MHLIEDIAKVIDESCDLPATLIHEEEAADREHLSHILKPSTHWTTTVGTTVPPDEQ